MTVLTFDEETILLDPKNRDKLYQLGEFGSVPQFDEGPPALNLTLLGQISADHYKDIEIIRCQNEDGEDVEDEMLKKIRERFVSSVIGTELVKVENLLPGASKPRPKKKKISECTPITGKPDPIIHETPLSFMQVAGTSQLIVPGNKKGAMLDALTKEPVKACYYHKPTNSARRMYIRCSQKDRTVNWETIDRPLVHDNTFKPLATGAPVWTAPLCDAPKSSTLKNVESLVYSVNGVQADVVIYVGAGNGFTSLAAASLNKKTQFHLFDVNEPHKLLFKKDKMGDPAFPNVVYHKKYFSTAVFDELKDVFQGKSILLYMDLFLKNFEDAKTDEEEQEKKLETMEIQLAWHNYVKPKKSRFKVFPPRAGCFVPEGGEFRFLCYTKFGSLESSYLVNYKPSGGLLKIDYGGYCEAILVKHRSRSNYHISPYPHIGSYDAVGFRRTFTRAARIHKTEESRVLHVFKLYKRDLHANHLLTELNFDSQGEFKLYEDQRMYGERTSSAKSGTYSNKKLPSVVTDYLGWEKISEPIPVHSYFPTNEDSVIVFQFSTVVTCVSNGKDIAKEYFEAGNVFRGLSRKYQYDLTRQALFFRCLEKKTDDVPMLTNGNLPQPEF